MMKMRCGTILTVTMYMLTVSIYSWYQQLREDIQQFLNVSLDDYFINGDFEEAWDDMHRRVCYMVITMIQHVYRILLTVSMLWYIQ